MGDGSSLGNLDGTAHNARFGKRLTAVGGPDGTVIIADHDHGTIRRLDRGGNVRTVHRFDGGIDLWADPQIGQAFVTESIGPENSRLITWGADDMVVTIATLWGSAGLDGVAPFARTTNGSVWFGDRHGRLLRQWVNGQIEQVGGGFSSFIWTDMEADSAGNVHVLESSRLSSFAPDGRVLGQWWVPGGGNGLAVVGGNQLWVSVVERDGDSRLGRLRLLRVGSDGSFEPIGPPSPGFDFYATRTRLVGATRDGRLLVATDGGIMQFHNNAWSLLAGSTAPSPFWSAPAVRVSESGRIVFNGQAYDAQGRPLGADFVPHLTTTRCFTSRGLFDITDPGQIARVTGPAEADRTTLPVTVPAPEIFCPHFVWQTASGRIYVFHSDGNPAPSGGTLSERLPDGTLRRVNSIASAWISSMIGSDDGRWLYLAAGTDSISNSSTQVLRVDLTTGVVDTLAGALIGGSIVDGTRQQARFVDVTLHAVDAEGNVYLTDSPLRSEPPLTAVHFPIYYSTGGSGRPRNTVVRRISSTGDTKTLAGSPNLYGYRAGPVPGSLPSIDSLAVDAQGVMYAASGPSVIRIEAP